MLELKNVASYYGSVQALRRVSLRVEQGEVVTLLGANGAGKSTTLRTISGLLRPTNGEVWFQGQPIHGMSTEKIVRLGISHVPEGRRIFPGLTVRENIMLGTSNRGRLHKKQMDEEVAEMFEIFPVIKPFEHALGWTLSGGQQQMLAVARGLMAKPKLLLLDEPSLGLAPVVVQQLFATIRVIHARGTTILLVEQNANMALSVANRGYVLETGEMKVEGSPRELLDNEQVRAAYLGGHG
ncbi:MAG TPA: ABC transporter ATP-binding protein [Burkholderiales bacterium]|nr:ABC transporter ATP-binding protein [Burkholderiales bacterium]